MAADDYKRNRLYAAATETQTARQLNTIPELLPDGAGQIGVYTKPLRVQDTFTAKEVREMRMAKRVNVVCIALTAVVVVLGIFAIVRFSSIFEISKQTRLLNKESAAVTETIIQDRTLLAAEKNSIDTEMAATELGLQKPQKYQIVKVHVEPYDMTVVHSSGEASQESEGLWYDNLFESVSRFFGKIDFAAQK
jgi:hypothetical protein